jgi:hypothetical protein
MLAADLQPLLDLTAPVLFFPVRHHSPTAARLVRDLIVRRKPTAVLIEGPADFNDRLDQLFLPHQPPLAVYSYVRLPDGGRRGAFYPLCAHSPEWQALEAGREASAEIAFIDLHWADIAGEQDEPSNRYADIGFQRSRYVADLCRRIGVDDFHALWDRLVEIDPEMSVETYLARCHQLCGHLRLLDGPGRLGDRRREAFMAERIREVHDRLGGQVVVVCGGYHCIALHARLTGRNPVEGLTDPAACEPSPPTPGEERGIALTPYSFERLDSLAGYEAGMPNPGFYQQVWLDRKAGRRDTHRVLLQRIVARLRERNQTVSAADLIATETMAQGLAALRGHAGVWRSDLVDGLIAALIKEEMNRAGRHPLLEAVHEVLRGGARGVLAEGTLLPPLVHDIRKQVQEQDLEFGSTIREIELELDQPAQRPRSRVLHRLRVLGADGYDRIGGSDLAARDDLTRIWESWKIAWSPDFDARCIEAARYGASLAEAAAARLAEQAGAIERNAAAAARLLIDAALAGLTDLAAALRARVRELIRSDGDFFGVSGTLGHLLYLYRYDAVLETAGSGEVADLLREAYGRALWLLESLGQVSDRQKEVLEGVGVLRETFERCETLLGLDRQEIVQVFERIGADRAQGALVRGATTGALWALGAADGERVKGHLRQFTDPDRLGDFLTGLFALAREQVQRQRDLVLSIHQTLAGYSDDEFLTALPALRLAFTYFTPREKHHMALTLRRGLGLEQVPEPAALTVNVATAARALALEGRVFAAVKTYGLRGGDS